MKVVFLDVDGVLNSERYWDRVRDTITDLDYMTGSGKLIDDEAVGRLNALIEATGAKVVVSSTWRRKRTVEELQALLASRGFAGDVVGKTADYVDAAVAGVADAREVRREHEIRHWLSTTDLNVDVFVILDDEAEMGSLGDRLVRVSGDVGLQDENVARAVRLLGS